MAAKKLTGIIGSGNIGTDPFDPASWSGLSRFFFEACSRQGMLEGAFGVEAPVHSRVALLIKNFSFERRKWRTNFYLDVEYYKVLTAEIRKKLATIDSGSDLIQIGGIYDVPSLVSGTRRCYSYHDGNLAQAIKSPYWDQNISRAKIRKAMDYEKNVYKNIDKIFTMSSYLRDSFINDFDIDAGKVICIGAGINLPEIPEAQFKDYSNMNVLFLGVDFYRKGGKDVADAFRIIREAIPNARLHVVGPRSKPEECSCEGIEYHGFLSKSDPTQKQKLEGLFRASSLFVMPSHYEPFGIAPLEAMIYEIPCVLSNNWAFPEMVTPGVNGELVEVGKVDQIAETCIRLLRDPDCLKRMGQAAREVVREKYTWEEVVKKLNFAVEL